MNPQVCADHYGFERYLTKERWSSFWHQMEIPVRLKSSQILEVGSGSGIYKAIGSCFGLSIATLDFDSNLRPDFVGSALRLPFADNSYDTVCAYQVLEHLPYEDSIEAFSEMNRVSSKNVIISIPNAARRLPLSIHIPTHGKLDILIPRPQFAPKEHIFDGEHYWELNKKGYSIKKFLADYGEHSELVENFRVPENPYHHFFIFRKR